MRCLVSAGKEYSHLEEVKKYENDNMSASSDDQHETKTAYFSPAISSQYLNMFFTSPLNNEWISSIIYDSLELEPNHTLVDMGCGPGLQLKMILNKMNNQIRVIGKYRNVFEKLATK